MEYVSQGENSDTMIHLLKIDSVATVKMGKKMDKTNWMGLDWIYRVAYKGKE